MKHFATLLLSLLFFACSSNDEDIQNPNNPDDGGNNNPSNVITASNFTKTMDENPINNFNIGLITASSQMPLTFEIISQTPANSISVISSSGLLKVADNTKFDYELNPVISGVVKISNATNSVNVTITINLNDIYECSTSKLNFSKNTVNQNFTQRSNHKIIFFNNKFWSYGGINVNTSGNSSNQIWSSIDGLNWTQEVSNANYGYLNGRIPVAFLNKVWLIGSGTTNSTEVWQSVDGKNFTQVTVNNSTLNNYGRSKHQLVVFNNKLYIIGGKLDGTYQSGVLSSTDGINWTSISTNNPFSPGRQNHVSLVFNNKLWVIGGDNPINQGEFNDAWSSTDGINWTLESVDGFKFSKRTGHTVIEYNGKLWLWGGSLDLGTGGISRPSDLWKSCDGKRWQQVDNLVSPLATQFPYKVVNCQTIKVGNQIISIGGYNGTSYEPIWIFNE
jgi:hypothetical protein